MWQQTLSAALVEMGFTPSKADPCLYRKHTAKGEIILGVYVDDLVIAYRGDELFKQFSAQFQRRFTARDEGPLKWFLGMAIDQDKANYSITVDHSLAISKIADKFLPHSDVTRTHPPDALFSKLAKAQSDEERAKAQEFEYASLVGALLYISVMSHPEVAYHTSILAKFLSDPSLDCCKAAVQLLQYLNATRDHKLEFTGKVETPEGLEKYSHDIERNCGFVAYSDSSWGNAVPYPMFGYGIYLYGGLISFASKQLKTVAHSSCEAEYAAASYCCKEIEFVRNICADMGVTLQGRLVLAVDNTAAIDVAHDVGVSSKTKHFDRAIHYIRDLTQMKRVVPAYVKTDKQKADGYTKALDKSKYLAWRKNVVTR